MTEGVERIGPRLWRTSDREGRVYHLRPIRPEDAPALQRAFAEQDPADRKLRLLSAIPKLPDRMALRFCTVDGVRDAALVLVRDDAPDALFGGARLMRDGAPGTPEGARAEFAVSVASALQGHGLGRKALATVMELGREMGIARVWGSVSRENAGMRALAARLGMTERRDPDDAALVICEKAL
ncbi:MAG: GNAT family N-acetyltransferase [Rubrimonas sp.]|uniref:GNAT family N-acetyltransferase n=1 Tax=Rubrimonas sp. TaxID=2036015 RepID=UPI002FDD4BFF